MSIPRYQRIEHKILGFVLDRSDASGYAVTFGDFTNALRETFSGITDSEIVDALKRLQPQYLTLRKWSDQFQQLLEYPSADAFWNDSDFFYSGDFRLVRTQDSGPHFQEVDELLRADQTQTPDTRLIERVLRGIVDKAEESWTEIGANILRQAAAQGGLNGRLHFEAKKQVDPLYDQALNKMVDAISQFAKKMICRLANSSRNLMLTSQS